MRHNSSVMNHNATPNRFFKNFAQDYLNYLGDRTPTDKQMAVIQALQAHTRIRQAAGHDFRLTAEEKQCLCLAAEGKRLEDIAACLGVSVRKMRQYRQSVLQKFGCKNMTSAIILGLRYGEIGVPEMITQGL